MLEAIGVIPARFGSSRFPGKVLADLFGKPLIQWTWEAVRTSSVLKKVIIACDNEEVFNVCKNFGAEVVYTSPQIKSGTDRICEVAKNIDAEIIVNIQADEPLIRGSMIDDLVVTVAGDPQVKVATLIKEITDLSEVHSPDVVKVVIDRHNFALYFSRSVIPYYREKNSAQKYYKHLGIYAYRKDFLFVFKNLKSSFLEEAEKLEQLRILEAGYKIKTVLTVFDTIGVDTPQDLEKVKEYLKTLGHA